ncbi:hypothetical protein Y032_0202g1766 [Ancylostoma ceylanicum]|uniref:Uncharacterized protein n=1 Tax=Ancylostoma ceylanicum TaxID=53326 RepID=A0A016SN07_9BILA|nr:hypothetical protein Y032_0202g1766 [Ancylostoma ceylanicum]
MCHFPLLTSSVSWIRSWVGAFLVLTVQWASMAMTFPRPRRARSAIAPLLQEPSVGHQTTMILIKVYCSSSWSSTKNLKQKFERRSALPSCHPFLKTFSIRFIVMFIYAVTEALKNFFQVDASQRMSNRAVAVLRGDAGVTGTVWFSQRQHTWRS